MAACVPTVDGLGIEAASALARESTVGEWETPKPLSPSEKMVLTFRYGRGASRTALSHDSAGFHRRYCPTRW